MNRNSAYSGKICLCLSEITDWRYKKPFWIHFEVQLSMTRQMFQGHESDFLCHFIKKTEWTENKAHVICSTILFARIWSKKLGAFVYT